jgi:myo-inositol-1(or 4)-monophosphatase
LPENDNKADLALLIGAARDAAEVARRHVGGDLEIVEKPDGAGPVTVADMAVNAVLEDRLRTARPGYGWLSEESPDSTERLARGAVFVVDPIDGTRSYIEGSGTWAHSIAVVRGGRVTAAVVYLPAKEKMYTARAGGGATLNGRTIRHSARAGLTGATLLAARPALEPANWRDGQVPPLARHHRPSLAYRLSLVAEGRFDAMLTLRDSWEWDIAAGALILAEAGAAVSDRTGAPLLFNRPWPKMPGVLAGSWALHVDLLARLAPPDGPGQ